ncbi:MAG: class I SAM-dependent methyltransferase [Proteobacteria bacterium]|nr:class I SAM-dependent methyltransferase [Pseudomonadota bacterium]
MTDTDQPTSSVTSQYKKECPLCSSQTVQFFCKDRRREYLRCSSCSLIFVPAPLHLTIDEQKSRYDLHRNDSEDPGYRAFLSRLVDPLVERLAPGARGLDFGSGPGPTLSLLLEERGFSVQNYDPFYAPDSTLLKKRYDFVACSETVEHFCAPATDWQLLFSLVGTGGVAAVMTAFVPAESEERAGSFAGWRYKDDPTHVTFYSKETFFWIAEKFGVKAEIVGESVVLFSF